MSALSIQVPFPVFQGRDGQPLENGYVWIGEPNLNPQTNPVVAYYDSALTIPAAQPLRTLNGYISRAGTPAQIYVDAANYSILVQDSKGSMVYNFPDGTGISPDACGVTYDPPFTDSVPYPVCEKLAQTVSLIDFGAVGDGVTDDTAAIQAAIDTGATHISGFNPASTPYLITNTLTLGSGQILDFGGSSIVAGAGAIGALASDGTHIRILNAANSAVRNLVVLTPLASIVVPGKQFQPAVVISTSNNCVLENITDQSGLGLAIAGVSSYNKITKSYTEGWLYYTYNGSNYNTVSLNTVKYGQIRGTGNAGVVVGNVVDSNTVIEPERMGIEDWSQYNPLNASYGVVTGTRITNNTIVGGSTVEYFAISCVSPLSVIDNNTVYNWPLSSTFGANSYTIEIVRGFGITATNNKVYWDNGVKQRVFQEVNPVAGYNADYDTPNIVSNNTSVDCGTFLFANTGTGSTTVVSGNTVRDCEKFVFANKQLVLSDNVIDLKVAPAATRVLFEFSTSGASAGSVIKGNLITYAAALNGSSFLEFTFYTTVNDLIIDGNVVNANSITAGGVAVTAITSNGQATTGMKAVNNIFLNGVQVNYGFMTNYVSANNTIPTFVSSSLNRTSFYDNQSLVTKQTVTGSKGANAALTSLLSALSAAGLITDSTT